MKTVFAAVGKPKVGLPATLHVYLQDASDSFAWKERPTVIVVPGGAYAYTSDREADPVAMQFLAMGYNAAVLRYSCAPSRYPEAIYQLGRSIVYLRRHAEEFKIDTGAIFIIGFSAGGHLVCSYCEQWTEPFIREKLMADLRNSYAREDKHIDVEELRPSGMMLGYPVITSGKYTHQDSIRNLLGDRETYEDPSEYDRLLDKLSLEKHVNRNVPPAFIWGTNEDGAVDPMNSVMLVESLMKEDIPVEYHLFRRGGHGLALGDTRTTSAGNEGLEYVPSISAWVSMAGTWIDELRREKIE